jgi:hypothetical protein
MRAQRSTPVNHGDMFTGTTLTPVAWVLGQHELSKSTGSGLIPWVAPVRPYDLGVEAANSLAAGEELFLVKGLFSFKHEVAGAGKLSSEDGERLEVGHCRSIIGAIFGWPLIKQLVTRSI